VRQAREPFMEPAKSFNERPVNTELWSHSNRIMGRAPSHYSESPNMPVRQPERQILPVSIEGDFPIPKTLPLKLNKPEYCIDQPAVQYDQQTGQVHTLVSHLFIRVYETDKSQISRTDLLHWLTYYRYSGVQHVYLYDCWSLSGESLEITLLPSIQSGFVTYVDWHEKEEDYKRILMAKPDALRLDHVFTPARQHCMTYYGSQFKWITFLDVDEFPYSPEDHNPGFLYRKLSSFVKEDSSVTEWTLENFLFLGWRNISDASSTVFEQVRRRTVDIANALVKPIALSSAIARPEVHHTVRSYGRSQPLQPHVMRMHHFWGGRLQNFEQQMSEDLVGKTQADNSMDVFVEPVKMCFSDSYPSV